MNSDEIKIEYDLIDIESYQLDDYFWEKLSKVPGLRYGVAAWNWHYFQRANPHNHETLRASLLEYTT